MSDRLLVLIVLIIGWPVSSSLAAQAKPMSVAELALYKGKDRETILLEGAKKEGTSHLLHFEYLDGGLCVPGIRPKISVHQDQRLAQRFKRVAQAFDRRSGGGSFHRRRGRNQSRLHGAVDPSQHVSRSVLAGTRCLTTTMSK